uniref:Uncharacterized protein n=1 Tax=Clytia hemisphaerica TaxID=252671 RepID=A0A7M5WKR4_9CNID
MPYYSFLEMLNFPDCLALSIGTAVSIYAQLTSFGTLIMISYLRNLAIRKPFYTVPQRKVYSALICWNLFAVLAAVEAYLIYKLPYLSQVHWFLAGLITGLVVTLATILNIWSKRILGKRSRVSSTDIEVQQHKRNKAAVKILNIILLIYAVCIMPFSIYMIILGVVMVEYKGKEDLLRSVYSLFSYVHLLIFPCSGLNALAYLLKDKKIKNYYKRLLRCN